MSTEQFLVNEEKRRTNERAREKELGLLTPENVVNEAWGAFNDAYGDLARVHDEVDSNSAYGALTRIINTLKEEENRDQLNNLLRRLTNMKPSQFTETDMFGNEVEAQVRINEMIGLTQEALNEVSENTMPYTEVINQIHKTYDKVAVVKSTHEREQVKKQVESLIARLVEEGDREELSELVAILNSITPPAPEDKNAPDVLMTDVTELYRKAEQALSSISEKKREGNVVNASHRFGQISSQATESLKVREAAQIAQDAVLIEKYQREVHGV
ncbi:MAG: hypothetical protein WC045_00630 [Patescibacteria group bacterium]